MSNRVRLIDVAREAGVSRVAAGKVLLGSGKDNVRVGEETAQRIEQAAKKLGYQPNRSAQRLGGRTGNLIGAVVHSGAPEIERERLVALERQARKQGYQLLVSSIPRPRDFAAIRQSASLLTTQGAAGIAFLTAAIPLAGGETRSELPARAVFCGIPSTIGDAPGVILDLAHGYRLAIRHFAKTGRRKVGVLGIEWRGGGNRFATYRLDAIREEAASTGTLAICPYPVSVEAGHRTPSAAQAEALVDVMLADKVDAILAYSDMTALRLIQVLHQRGVRVPDSMAVCGLNNLELAELASPPLTTIDERAEDVAAAMLESILEQIQSPDKPSAQRVIQPRLIVRDST